MVKEELEEVKEAEEEVKEEIDHMLPKKVNSKLIAGTGNCTFTSEDSDLGKKQRVGPHCRC